MLKEILSGEATENVVSKIHDVLTALGTRVRSGDLPIEEFIIFKVSYRVIYSASDSSYTAAPREKSRGLP